MNTNENAQQSVPTVGKRMSFITNTDLDKVSVQSSSARPNLRISVLEREKTHCSTTINRTINHLANISRL